MLNFCLANFCFPNASIETCLARIAKSSKLVPAENFIPCRKKIVFPGSKEDKRFEARGPNFHSSQCTSKKARPASVFFCEKAKNFHLSDRGKKKSGFLSHFWKLENAKPDLIEQKWRKRQTRIRWNQNELIEVGVEQAWARAEFKPHKK